MTYKNFDEFKSETLSSLENLRSDIDIAIKDIGESKTDLELLLAIIKNFPTAKSSSSFDSIHAKAISRIKNREWLAGKGKATVVVAGLLPYIEGSKQSECSECNRTVYTSDVPADISDMVCGNPKILCPYCVLKQDEKEQSMNPEAREAMLSAIKNFENLDFS